ncbi:methyltransferase, FxLD system [Kitasatospora sp. NPDC004240]
MRTVPPEQWEQHYSNGVTFSSLGDNERALLAEHAPAPEGGRALEVGCGAGELAAHLAEIGYQVDAVDLADAGLLRARASHPGAKVRWLRLDIEHDDPAPLGDAPYDLVVFRLSVAFVHDRTRVLHTLGRRLGVRGTLLVITPVAAHTPAERRHIALDEEEITALTCGWQSVQRLAAGDLAVLVLRDPRADTVEVERQLPPTGPAAIGAVAVVTDRSGRVLLGYSRDGMWELPGGKTAGGESFEAAAVRELDEETGLHAAEADATVLTVLTDDSHGVPRLTAVVRIARWSGKLANPEADKFVRWEWHDLNGLSRLGPLFTPAAQALHAVWPGIVPHQAAVCVYPHDAEQPAVPGESAEATRRREAMAQAVIDADWAPSAEVRAALRVVPRHRFAPEASLADAYHHDLALITRRDGLSRGTSSVSAVWLQADMLENARLRPGAAVLEVGSGGYNAALIAHVVGPTGRVVTVDLDPFVVERTCRFTAEAGSRNVIAVQGDGALGAPATAVPRGGFDAIIVTYNAWDIAPAWREQLAEGGHLVVPLEVHGYTRAITLQRRGEELVARGWTYCGFIRDSGALGRTTPETVLAGGELRLRFEDGPVGEAAGLEEALRGERHEVRTGVTVARSESFETLQLYLATVLHQQGFCRLAKGRKMDTGIADIPPGADAAALLGKASLAYLTYTPAAPAAPDGTVEFAVHAYGQAGPTLAERLMDAVRDWDDQARAHGYPELTIHPASTPDTALPGGHRIDKPGSRLAFHWHPLAPDPGPAASPPGTFSLRITT